MAWPWRARAVALGATGIAAVAASGVAAQAAALGTVTSCTQSALKSAIAGGGSVVFGVDCPDLVLTSALTISGSVSIDANGHTVALDGGNATRLFVIKAGTVSMTGLTLENGRVAGANGANGAAGSPG